MTRSLLHQKRFAREPILLSGAGSAWYDVVAEEFSAADLGDAVEIVLRPGCYLTHDVGNYETQQKRILAVESDCAGNAIGTGACAACMGVRAIHSRGRAGHRANGKARRGIRFWTADAGTSLSARERGPKASTRALGRPRR